MGLPAPVCFNLVKTIPIVTPAACVALRSQFNLGVDIGATSNPDPTPDGEFFSWLAQAQRVQRLGKK